jgi:arylsulfatase A-like enzyme
VSANDKTNFSRREFIKTTGLAAYKGKWHLTEEFETVNMLQAPMKLLSAEMEEYGFSDYFGIGDIIAHTNGRPDPKNPTGFKRPFFDDDQDVTKSKAIVCSNTFIRPRNQNDHCRRDNDQRTLHIGTG